MVTKVSLVRFFVIFISVYCLYSSYILFKIFHTRRQCLLIKFSCQILYLIWLQKTFVSHYKRKERHKTTHTHTHYPSPPKNIHMLLHTLREIPTREMNWLLLALLLLLYYCVSHESFPFLFLLVLNIYIVVVCFVATHVFHSLSQVLHTLFSYIYVLEQQMMNILVSNILADDDDSLYTWAQQHGFFIIYFKYVECRH